MPESPNIPTQSYNRQNDFLDTGSNNVATQTPLIQPKVSDSTGGNSVDDTPVDKVGVLDHIFATLGDSAKAQNPFISSLDFTTPIRTPVEQTRRYDDPVYGYDPLNPELEHQYADRQSFLAQWGNNLLKFGANAGGAFVETLATLPMVGYAIKEGDFSKLFNNEFTNSIAEWMEDLETTLPNYQSAFEDNHPILSYINPKYWGNSWGGVLKNLGYTVGALSGAIVEDSLVGLATGGTGVAPLLGPQLMRIFGRVGHIFASEKGAVRVAESLVNAKNVKEAVDSVYNTVKIKDRARYGLSLFNSALGEAIFEANGTSRAIEDNLYQDFREKYGRDPLGDEAAKIREYAAGGGNADLLLNTGLLMLTNHLTLGTLLKPRSAAIRTLESRLMDGTAVGLQKGSVDVFEQVASKAKRFKILDSTPSRLLRANAVEGFEEGSQFLFQRSAEDYYKRKFNDESISQVDNFMKSVGVGLKDTLTTREGLENIFMGIMSGAVIHGGKKLIEKYRGIDANKNDLLKSTLTLLNSERVSGLFENKYSEAVTAQSIANDMKRALQEGNVFEYQNLKFQQLFNFVSSGIKANKFDLRLDQLQLMKEMQGSEFEKAFGIDFNQDNKNTVNQYVDSVIAKVKEIKSNIDKVNTIFKNPYPNAAGNQNFIAFEEYKTQLALNLSEMVDNKRRLNSLTQEMQALAPTIDIHRTIDLTHKVGLEQVKENFENRIKEIDKTLELLSSDKTSEAYKKAIEEKKWLEGKLPALTESIAEGYHPDIYAEVGDILNYYANGSQPANDTLINPIDLLPLLEKAKDAFRLTNANNAALYHYQQLTGKKGMDDYIESILETRAQYQGKAEANNPLKTQAQDNTDDEVIETDANGNEVATPNATSAAESVNQTAQSQPSKQRKPKSESKKAEAAKKEFEAKKAELAKMKAENKPQAEVQKKEAEVQAAEQAASEEEVANNTVDETAEEVAIDGATMSTKNAEQEIDLSEIEDTETGQPVQRKPAQRYGVGAQSEFKGTDPQIILNKLVSINYSDDKYRDNLVAALFGNSLTQLYNKLGAIAYAVTKGLPVGKFKAIDGTNLFRSRYSANVELVVDGKGIGLLHPHDSVFFLRDGKHVSIYELKPEEYESVTNNDLSTYESFMQEINAYKAVVEPLIQKFKAGKTEFQNEELKEIIDIRPQYGRIDYSNNQNDSTLIKDLEYTSKGDALISLPMVKNDKGEWVRSSRPVILNKEELSEEDHSKLIEFIANNIEGFQNVNSRYFYVFQLPDGSYRSSSKVAARPAEADPAYIQSLIDRIKKLPATPDRSVIKKLNEDLRNTVFISDSKNRGEHRVKLHLAVSNQGSLFINIHAPGRYTRGLLLPSIQEITSPESLMQYVDDTIQRKAAGDSALSALNLSLSARDLKTFVSNNTNIKLADVADKLKVSVKKHVFKKDEANLFVLPKKAEAKENDPASTTEDRPVVKPQAIKLTKQEAAAIKAIKENIDTVQGAYRPTLQAAINGTPTEQRAVIGMIYQQFRDVPLGSRAIFGDAIAAHFYPMIGASMVKDKRSLQHVMENVFKLPKEQALAVAEIYNRVAKVWAARNNKEVADFYKQLSFMDGKNDSVPAASVLNQSRSGFTHESLRAIVANILEVTRAEFDTFLNKYQKSSENEREDLVNNFLSNKSISQHGLGLFQFVLNNITKSGEKSITSKNFDEIRSLAGVDIVEDEEDRLQKNFRKLFKKLKIKDPLNNLPVNDPFYDGKVKGLNDITENFEESQLMRRRPRRINEDDEAMDFGEGVEDSIEDIAAAHQATIDILDAYFRTPEDQQVTNEEFPNADFTEGIAREKDREMRSGKFLNQKDNRNINSVDHKIRSVNRYYLLAVLRELQSYFSENKMTTDSEAIFVNNLIDLLEDVQKTQSLEKEFTKEVLPAVVYTSLSSKFLRRIAFDAFDLTSSEAETFFNDQVGNNFSPSDVAFHEKIPHGKFGELVNIHRNIIKDILEAGTGDRQTVYNTEDSVKAMTIAGFKQWFANNANDIARKRMATLSTNPTLLNQEARAAIHIAVDGQAMIYALTNPNVSSPLHELAHFFEQSLSLKEQTTVLEWAGHDDWTVETSEKFARGFEAYLAEGNVESKGLKAIFESFKKWLTEIYKGLVGSAIDVELNDKMRNIYRTMLGEKVMQEIKQEVQAEKKAEPKPKKLVENKSQTFEEWKAYHDKYDGMSDLDLSIKSPDYEKFGDYEVKGNIGPDVHHQIYYKGKLIATIAVTGKGWTILADRPIAEGGENKKIEGAKSRYQAVRAVVEQNELNVKTPAPAMTAVLEDEAEMNQPVIEAEENVSISAEELEAANGQIAALEARIAKLQARTDGDYSARIADLQEEINQIKSFIGTNEQRQEVAPKATQKESAPSSAEEQQSGTQKESEQAKVQSKEEKVTEILEEATIEELIAEQGGLMENVSVPDLTVKPEETEEELIEQINNFNDELERKFTQKVDPQYEKISTLEAEENRLLKNGKDEEAAQVRDRINAIHEHTEKRIESAEFRDLYDKINAAQRKLDNLRRERYRNAKSFTGEEQTFEHNQLVSFKFHKQRGKNNSTPNKYKVFEIAVSASGRKFYSITDGTATYYDQEASVLEEYSDAEHEEAMRLNSLPGISLPRETQHKFATGDIAWITVRDGAEVKPVKVRIVGTKIKTKTVNDVDQEMLDQQKKLNAKIRSLESTIQLAESLGRQADIPKKISKLNESKAELANLEGEIAKAVRKVPIGTQHTIERVDGQPFQVLVSGEKQEDNAGRPVGGGITLEDQITVNSFSLEPDIEQEFDDFNYAIDFTAFKTVFENLKARFGIDYELVHDPELSWKGRFVNGKVYINTAKADRTTPFHEYLHPWLEVLEKDNPKLFEQLTTEFQNVLKNGDELALESVGEVKRNKEYQGISAEDLFKEALVRYISKLAAENVDRKGRKISEKKHSAMKRLVEKFRNWLQNIWKTVSSKIGGTGLKPMTLKTFSEEDIKKDKKKANDDPTKRIIVNFENASLQDIADIFSLTDVAFDLTAHMDYLQTLDLLQTGETAAPPKGKSKSKKKKSKVPQFAIDEKAIIDRLKKRLSVLDDTAKRRIRSEVLQGEVNRIRRILENENTTEAIDKFVRQGLRGLKWANDEFLRITGQIKNPDAKLTQEEVRELNRTLALVKNLVAFYQDDVQRLFRHVIDPSELSPQAYNHMNEILRKSEILVQDVKSRSIDLITEWLYPSVEHTNELIKEKYPQYVLSKEDFKKQLWAANGDIDRMFFWLGSVSSSRDPVSAIVSDVLKDVVEEVHMYDAAISEEIKNTYHQFLKDKGLANDRNTTAEYYKQNFLRKARVLEKVGEKLNADGKPEPVYDYVERWAFHEEFLYDKWYEAATEFLKTLGEPRPVESVFGEGTVTDPAYVEKINQWQAVNGTLSKPSELYRNPEFKKLYNQDKMFTVLYNHYRNGNEKLGSYDQLKFGVIPQVSKGKGMFSDLNWSKNGAVNVLKRIGNFIAPQADPNDYVTTLENLDGSIYRKIKVAYTRPLQEEDLDFSLPETVFKYAGAQNLVSLMQEVEPNVATLKNLLEGDKKFITEARKVNKVSSSRKVLFDSVFKRPAKELAPRVNRQLSAFIDDVVYGETEDPAIINAFGRAIDLQKLGGNLSFLTALNNMALNITAGISNVTIGNIQTLGESLGGKYYKPENWRKAQAQYFSSTTDFIKDTMELKKTKVTQLGIKYDAIQGEFRDKYGKRFVGSVAQKYATMDTIFFLSHTAEHQIQLTGMLALMDATKVAMKDGSTKSLFDAHIINEKGFLVLDPNAIWTKEQEADFTKRLHGLNKMLNGNYSKFDKAYLQRRWYGKLALIYRKFLYNSFRARWGRGRMDYELKDNVEGYYRTFLKKLHSDWKAYGMEAITKSTWNADEKYARAKTLYEMGILISTLLISLALAGAEDDKEKDKSWFENYLALMNVRLRGDIGTYSVFGYSEVMRMLKNPSAVLQTTSKYGDFFWQLVTGPFDEYKRKTGVFAKGDSILWAKFQKMIPLWRQFINIQQPEEQKKFYTLINKNF